MAPALEELQQIAAEASRAHSLDDLRGHFERIRIFRTAYADDFDALLAIGDVQEFIVERARSLRPPAIHAREQTHSTAQSHNGAGVELSPDSERIDQQNWQRVVYIALFFAVILFAAFFYLIQTARRLNFISETPATAAVTAPASGAKAGASPASTEAAATKPDKPAVRLYTDLVPGTVTIDDNTPEDLKDGELTLDKLEPGHHTMHVAGSSGDALFSYDVTDGGVPRIAGVPSASNAMAVLVATESGQAHLVSNAQNSAVSLDGKPAGDAGSDGLVLSDLGTTDHLLQVSEGSDHQRFVLTHTGAPTLTVYVKSDPNAGTVVVMTKLDGADVYIDEKLYRRKTEAGQLRIPLKVGQYELRVHKQGYIDPPPASVAVKKAEETAVTFKLDAAPQIATLQVKGALPSTMLYIDHDFAATTGADGSATVPNVKPGVHAIELRRDQALPKKFDRTFQTGEQIVLSGPDVTLEHATVDAAATTAAPATTAAVTATPSAAQNFSMQMDGQQVRTGGGFVPYHIPHVAGHYSFAGQARLGGFLKRGKLQWYAAYRDASNYILFTIDGKHATVRQMRDGKAKDISRIPFEAESNTWVQVDMSVKPNSLDTRVKTAEGTWSDLGSVPADGQDFTQGKVGFYIPDKDSIAVSNFRFYAH